MTIKTRLRLNTFISLTVLIIIMLSLVWSFWEVSRATRNMELVAEMRKVAFERIILRDDYLLYHEERARTQWIAKSETFRGILESASNIFTRSEDQALLKEARGYFDASFTSFSQFMEETKKEENTSKKINDVTEAESRLIGQVFLKAYALNDSITRLHESALRIKTNAWNSGLFIIIVSIFGGFFAIIINSVSTYGILAKRIAALGKGVEIIGAGNLDHRIEIKGDDELCDLALTSNEMAVKLQKSYTSQENLQKEIDNRKLAEAELKRSEEFIRGILSSVDEAFVVIDRDYRIISANRAFSDQTGMPLADITGRHCYEISHHLTRPCHEVDRYCACKRTFETGEPTVFVNTLTDEKGNQTDFETKTYAMKDESGNVKSVIEIINDITEKIKLEAQVRQSQKMEAIGTLAGGIAHDFNNILTAIIGYGYIALKNIGPDDPLRRNIEHMLEGADRAANLTKDLLIFSRKQVSEKKPVDLNNIIRKVENFLERVIGEDINCIMTLHSEPIFIYADTHQLEQVLMNLATNARDSMAKGGDLIICAEQIILDNDFVTIHGYGKPGCYALLTISDTGEGMDEETLMKIFDPFFTTKEVGKGTGLGLAVAYGIIKQHEGYIDVYSKPGAGTSFKIYLPLILPEARGEKLAHDEETLTRGTETILLAEDDESTRNLISAVLKQGGYTVIEAVDGKDAVMKFMENKDTIHFLLFDLIMPKMNGKEAYDEIERMRPGLKAIFASGYAPDFIRQKVLLESSVELIYKPILPFDLLEKIRNLLDEGEK